MKAKYAACYRAFRQAIRLFEYDPWNPSTAYDSAWLYIYQQYGYLLALRVMLAYCDWHDIQVDPVSRQRASISLWAQ